MINLNAVFKQDWYAAKGRKRTGKLRDYRELLSDRNLRYIAVRYARTDLPVNSNFIPENLTSTWRAANRQR